MERKKSCSKLNTIKAKKIISKTGDICNINTKDLYVESIYSNKINSNELTVNNINSNKINTNELILGGAKLNNFTFSTLNIGLDEDISEDVITTTINMDDDLPPKLMLEIDIKTIYIEPNFLEYIRWINRQFLFNNITDVKQPIVTLIQLVVIKNDDTEVTFIYTVFRGWIFPNAIESATVSFSFSDEDIETIKYNSTLPEVKEQFIRISLYGSDELQMVKYNPQNLIVGNIKGITKEANTASICSTILTGN